MINTLDGYQKVANAFVNESNECSASNSAILRGQHVFILVFNTLLLSAIKLKYRKTERARENRVLCGL